MHEYCDTCGRPISLSDGNLCDECAAMYEAHDLNRRVAEALGHTVYIADDIDIHPCFGPDRDWYWEYISYGNGDCGPVPDYAHDLNAIWPVVAAVGRPLFEYGRGIQIDPKWSAADMATAWCEVFLAWHTQDHRPRE